MVKLQYALESEQKYNEVNEIGLLKRRLLDRCVNTYIYGKNKQGKAYLNKSQQSIMNDFFNYLLTSRKSRLKSPHSILGIFSNVSRFLRDFKKPLDNINKKDLAEYFADLQRPKNEKKPISDHVVLDKQLHIRQFLRWYFDDPKHPSISWMKITIKCKRDIDPSELLTSEDIKKMIETSGSKRDACIIMLGYECGLRASEISNIRIKNIQNTEYGSKIKVKGKTGERTAFLIKSQPYLKDWLNEHPYRSNPEAPLFINIGKRQFGRQLLGVGILDVVKKAGSRAGIQKKVYTHLMRHSILNDLGKQGFKERDLRIFAGWKGDSRMPDVYLHYGEEEIEKKLLDVNGIKNKEEGIKEDKTLEPKICFNCKQKNPATSVYCDCGMALDLKTIIKDTERREKADNELNKLFEDEEFKDLVKSYLKKKAIGD